MSEWQRDLLANGLPFLAFAVVFLILMWRVGGRYRQSLALQKEAIVSTVTLQKEAVALHKEAIADQRKILDTLLEIKLALKGERN
jgi:hypothetical protein